jgi:hypothetical protein
VTFRMDVLTGLQARWLCIARYALAMWAPKSWDDVQVLVGQAVETAQLEFKETVTTNGREIAKDIAAMTVNGGVLLYGIPEDPDAGLANPPVPIKVKGLEARLRQIAGR